MLRPVVRQVVQGWVTSGAIATVWIATPCSSWSRARHGPRGSAWGPLRDADHLEGLADLADVDKAKVIVGNKLRDFTCSVVRWCAQRGTPCVVENPISSMLWASKAMQDLKKLPGFGECFFDFCQFGTSFRKRTRLWYWHFPNLESVAFHCTGTRGNCSQTGKLHVHLTGRDIVSKELWTKIATPYPMQLVQVVANLITDLWELKRHMKLCRIALRP